MIQKFFEDNYKPINIMANLSNIDSEIRNDLSSNSNLLMKFDKFQDEMLNALCEAERNAYISGIKDAVKFMVDCIK